MESKHSLVDSVIQKLNDYIGKKVDIELYHHDDSSEPFSYISGSILRAFSESVEGHGNIITIITNETSLSFSEKNYNFICGYIEDGIVIFNSKNDDETYCKITFY